MKVVQPVYLEVGRKRVFAAAVDWPGWCRAGRDEESALEALASSASRYGAVLSTAGLLDGGPPGTRFEVTERLEGDATTDFGAPGRVPEGDRAGLSEGDVERLCAILLACWSAFEAAVAAARGLELRKGPRGGGRDLEGMVEHVDGADLAYLRALGSTGPGSGLGSPDEQRAEVRRRALAAVRARASGRELEHPRAARTVWPPRYYVRRAAWHALDHAWEIEDRALPRS